MLIALRWLESSKSPFKISESQLEVTIAFRLLGRVEQFVFRGQNGKALSRSQSPFGFLGEWNQQRHSGVSGHPEVTIAFRLLEGVELDAHFDTPRPELESQSPFGFWGEWNPCARAFHRTGRESHNRLSAFGGWKLIGCGIYAVMKYSSQSPFGFLGEWNLHYSA